MKINTAYLNFLNLVDRNATNNNVSVDKPRFVSLFNSTQIKYVEWMLEHRNSDRVRIIAKLLILDKQLQNKEVVGNHVNFKLPLDFFDLSNLQVFGSKGSCKSKKLYTFEIKSEDTEELFRDVNMRPSFEYREVPYFLNGNRNISVFKEDFTIDNALITYYRYPKKVDMQGIITEDGSTTQDSDPEFSDAATGFILEAMAKAYSANNSDGQAYQISKDRLFTNI